MKSEFMTWFRAQFGRRPGGNKDTSTLVREHAAAYMAKIKAQELLDARLEYDKKLDAATTAWFAARKPRVKK